MKTTVTTLCALALGVTALSSAQTQSPTKVGIIHIQNAILSTNDGKKAADELQKKFAPSKANLEKMQNDIAQVEDRLRKGSNTMSEEARQQLMRERDQKATSLKRATEDAQAEVEHEEGRIMQDLGQRIMAVIDKYAKDNGYALILDVSNPQTPVLYAANGIDITKDIIDLYDKNAPAPASAAPPAAAPKPAAPAVTRPVTPAPKPAPPTKK